MAPACATVALWFLAAAQAGAISLDTNFDVDTQPAEEDPRKEYLAKFMKRGSYAAPGGASSATALKQCIVTPANGTKCEQRQETRLHNNKNVYAAWHGYELKYIEAGTQEKGRCRAFWSKIDSVLAAIKDGCDLVMYMDSNIALTNMALKVHQFLDQNEDAVFNALEHFDTGKEEIDHGMFVVRGSTKVVDALAGLKASTKCATNGVIETGLKSDKWNMRVFHNKEAAVFSSQSGSKELTWKEGDFSVQFVGDRCALAGDFLDKAAKMSNKGADAIHFLQDIERQSSSHNY